MQINRKVRDITTPPTVEQAGAAKCLCFATFESSKSLALQMSTWLDQLKSDVEIVGVEAVGDSRVLVCFVIEDKVSAE